MLSWFSKEPPFGIASPILFLDRDGVINEENRNFIRRWEDVKIHRDAAPALRRAQILGFRLVMVSNQSGIARGYIDLQTFWEIHFRLMDVLASNGVYFSAAFFCPHHPEDGCLCRKPSPEMLLFATELFGVPVEKSFFVGDRISDTEAAARAGCRGILLRRDLPETSSCLESGVCTDLLQAVALIEKLLKCEDE